MSKPLDADQGGEGPPHYRAYLARQKETAELKAHATKVLKGVPYRAMQKAGWIEDTSDRVRVLRALMRFFRVGTPHQLEAEQMLAEAAFRRSQKFKSAPLPLAAWL
ncbi:MAG: hypothetical protein AB2A00_30265 [Myxococcota bacterium]